MERSPTIMKAMLHLKGCEHTIFECAAKKFGSVYSFVRSSAGKKVASLKLRHFWWGEVQEFFRKTPDSVLFG